MIRDNGIRSGLVVGVGDLEPGIPGSIPSYGAVDMVECSKSKVAVI